MHVRCIDERGPWACEGRLREGCSGQLGSALAEKVGFLG